MPGSSKKIRIISVSNHWRLGTGPWHHAETLVATGIFFLFGSLFLSNYILFVLITLTRSFPPTYLAFPFLYAFFSENMVKWQSVYFQFRLALRSVIHHVFQRLETLVRMSINWVWVGLLTSSWKPEGWTCERLSASQDMNVGLCKVLTDSGWCSIWIVAMFNFQGATRTCKLMGKDPTRKDL